VVVARARDRSAYIGLVRFGPGGRLDRAFGEHRFELDPLVEPRAVLTGPGERITVVGGLVRANPNAGGKGGFRRSAPQERDLLLGCGSRRKPALPTSAAAVHEQGCNGDEDPTARGIRQIAAIPRRKHDARPKLRQWHVPKRPSPGDGTHCGCRTPIGQRRQENGPGRVEAAASCHHAGADLNDRRQEHLQRPADRRGDVDHALSRQRAQRSEHGRAEKQ
jgi:hypothetical protein